MRSDRGPNRELASLFQSEDRCLRCPAHRFCSARTTPDACGHPVEYPGDALTVEDFPLATPADLDLPTGERWMPFPDLGPALHIAQDDGHDGDGIRLKRVLRTSPNLHNRVAVLHGSDEQLARLGMTEATIGASLAHRGALAAIGPGFSTWWTSTPFESHIAATRSAQLAALLSRHLPVAPTLVGRHARDMDRWAPWITSESISTIAVHLSERDPAAFEQSLKGLASLAAALDARGVAPHLIANGPSTLDRMSQIRLAWPNGLTFASQNPEACAKGGRRLDLGLRTSRDDSPIPELIDTNRATFASIAEDIVGSGKKLAVAV